MHTYKLIKVLDFKIMGYSGHDQTACLAEDRSRSQHNYQHLTREPRKPIRTKLCSNLARFIKASSLIMPTLSHYFKV